MWIIKCKLPGVICHVARRTQGVSNSEQMLLSTSQEKKKKIFHVGHSFLCCLWCQMAKLGAASFYVGEKKNTFAHVLIAFKHNNNERGECRGAAQVAGTAALDLQLRSRIGWKKANEKLDHVEGLTR